MKRTILFGIAMLMATAGIVVSGVNWQPALAEELTRVGGQGEIDFVVVPSDLQKNSNLLKMACRRYTNKHTDYFCKMLMWTDKKDVPKRLPMSAQQLKTQFACYDFNLSTGLNRLRILRNGNVVEEL
ncbi:MAG: hypothetical protein JNN26_22325 [Candidatus Obscuribacter sp.]|nr:hypothetical protein [Candidatus Obscuribacter sp.]